MTSFENCLVLLSAVLLVLPGSQASVIRLDEPEVTTEAVLVEKRSVGTTESGLETTTTTFEEAETTMTSVIRERRSVEMTIGAEVDATTTESSFYTTSRTAEVETTVSQDLVSEKTSEDGEKQSTSNDSGKFVVMTPATNLQETTTGKGSSDDKKSKKDKKDKKKRPEKDSDQSDDSDDSDED